MLYSHMPKLIKSTRLVDKFHKFDVNSAKQQK